MATRSNIGYENEDGTVTYVYCHFDGYPSHNGQILVDYYTDLNRVKALVSYGDMSCLEPRFEPANAGHSQDDPEGGVVIYYGRDCGENGTEPRTKSYSDLLDLMEEYAYVMKPSGEWLMTSRYPSESKGIWRPVEMELNEE